MSEGTAQSPPRIVLGGGPLDELFALLHSGYREGSRSMRLVVRAVIGEGRRFAETPEGRHAAYRLVRSRLFKNGKVLWTMGGVDEFLAESGEVDRPLPDLVNIVDALRHSSIEDYLMRFLEEYAEKRHRGDATGYSP